MSLLTGAAVTLAAGTAYQSNQPLITPASAASVEDLPRIKQEMVLPRNGLTDENGHPVRYDKVYYIGEQDFYIPRDEEGEFKKYEGAGDNYGDAIEVMKGLVPTHVVFNGKAGSLTGDNAMTAKNHESVLFIHAQANRDTRPHLIGGHGDYVWESGAFLAAPVRNLETWFIRGGSAGAAICSFHQPGLYV